MPTAQIERQEIKPAAPESAVRELLMVPAARRLSLRAGHSWEGRGCLEEYQLVAALGGALTVSAYQQYALLDSGQALALLCPGPYAVQAVSDCLCMTVSLQGELPGRLLGPRLTDGAALFPRGAAAVREMVASLAVLDEEHPPVDGAAASAQAYSLLLKLSSASLEADSGLSPLVESAIAIIQEDFPYLEGLDELAERLEISKAHLSRSFMKKTGISPGKYLTHVRVEYAKLLLQDESVSITYVAEASGFANANYFAKVFRRETGMSPSEYLEAMPRRRPPLRRMDRPLVL